MAGLSCVAVTVGVTGARVGIFVGSRMAVTGRSVGVELEIDVAGAGV